MLVVACKHTGYRWGFGMTHKSESLGILTTFFDMDGRGNRCSYFRTDGATEFKSKAFIRLIEKFGIFLEKCLEYAHQTNGTVERSMQTIMADVRTSLLSSRLPHSYWLYAALWSIQMRNILPRRRNGDWRSPWVETRGYKPNVKGLRAFGADTWVHRPSGQRKAGKLGSSHEPGAPGVQSTLVSKNQ